MDLKNKLTPENLFFTFHEPPEAKYATNKPPIIFIHGILSTPYCWNKVKNKICVKTGRKAYAICLRNHGTSGWSEEFSVNHIVTDLKNFMMKENISKAILVSHSLGARAAITLALEEPEMVEKLIVEDMILTFDEDQSQAARKFISILKMAASSLKQYPPSMSEAVAQKRLQQLFCLSWSKKPNEKTNSRPITPILPFHKEKSGKFVWDVNVDALAGGLEDISSKFKIRLSDYLVYPGEAIFIGAEYSKFDVVNDKQVILKHFPNSKFSVAKGVYHSYHMEKPDEYAEEVAEFIGA
ncbi:Protein ABHD11 [Araneus ventricosus]|uniref:sn-1-specific diacylglycerol lipase ABHD11 n=1 Tax=Araneus ventricosus TaxID=182803 RepID=A0A4Y2HVH1_ARAVE|nr:Protein ABHD11 [Araneus ventricosus]